MTKGTTTSIILTFLGLQLGKILIAYPNPRQRITRWLIWGTVLGMLWLSWNRVVFDEIYSSLLKARCVRCLRPRIGFRLIRICGHLVSYVWPLRAPALHWVLSTTWLMSGGCGPTDSPSITREWTQFYYTSVTVCARIWFPGISMSTRLHIRDHWLRTWWASPSGSSSVFIWLRRGSSSQSKSYIDFHFVNQFCVKF